MDAHRDESTKTMRSWASRIPFTVEAEQPQFTSETEIIVVRRRNSITFPIRAVTPTSPAPNTSIQTQKARGGTSNTSHQRRKSIALPTSNSNHVTSHQPFPRHTRAISPTSRLLSPTVASSAGRYRWNPAVNLGYMSPIPLMTESRTRKRASTQSSDDLPAAFSTNKSPDIPPDAVDGGIEPMGVNGLKDAGHEDENVMSVEETHADESHRPRESGLLQEAQLEFVNGVSEKLEFVNGVSEELEFVNGISEKLEEGGEGEEGGGKGGGSEKNESLPGIARPEERATDVDDDKEKDEGENEDEDEDEDDIDRARVLRYAESRSRRASNPFDDSFAL
jgi:hypothetical protein